MNHKLSPVNLCNNLRFTPLPATFILAFIFILIFATGSRCYGSGEEDRSLTLDRRGALRSMGAALASMGSRTTVVVPNVAANDAALAAAAEIAQLRAQLAAAAASQQHLESWIGEAIEGAAKDLFSGLRLLPLSGNLSSKDPDRIDELLEHVAKNRPPPTHGPEWEQAIKSRQWSFGWGTKYHSYGEYLNRFWGQGSMGGLLWSGRERFIDIISDWAEQKPAEAAGVHADILMLIRETESFPIFGRLFDPDPEFVHKSFELAKLVQKITNAVKSDPWRSFSWFEVFKNRNVETLVRLTQAYKVPMDVVEKLWGLLMYPDDFMVCSYPILPVNKAITSEFLQALAAELKVYSPRFASEFAKASRLDRGEFNQDLVTFQTSFAPSASYNEAYRNPLNSNQKLILRIRDKLLKTLNISFSNGRNRLQLHKLPNGIQWIFRSRVLTRDELKYFGFREVLFGTESSVPIAFLPFDIALENLNIKIETLNNILLELNDLPDTDFRHAWLMVGETIRNYILWEIRTLPQKHRAYMKIGRSLNEYLSTGNNWVSPKNLKVQLNQLPPGESTDWLNPVRISQEATILDQKWLAYLDGQGIDLSPLNGLEKAISGSVRPLAAFASAVSNNPLIADLQPKTFASATETPRVEISKILDLISQADVVETQDYTNALCTKLFAIVQSHTSSEHL